MHWLLFVTPAITSWILLSIHSVCEFFFKFFSEVTASSGVKIYRLVFVRDIVSYARQCVSANCLLYMEHRVVIHTEYTEKWGQSVKTALDGILLYNFLQHVSAHLKTHLQAKRGHLIHQINIFIFRTVSYQVFYHGCLGPETKYKQGIK